MLDTIGLRLHAINDIKTGTINVIKAENGLSPYAVPAHNDLYKKMMASKDRDFTMTVHYSRERETYEQTDPETVHILENAPKLTKHWSVKDRMRFIHGEKSKDVIKGINGEYRVPSSFSDATFFINPNAGYIDFQVSIPKYLYGHSLAQFIPQENSELKFEHGIKFNDWNFQKKHLYARLRKFIDKFFTDLCHHFGVEVLPDENYIEVTRLDLCYNMYFKDKEEALKVLDNLKKIDKKRRKKKLNDGLMDHDTTLDFKSSVGAYYKIYHKGTEYSESKYGDLRKHLKINREYIEKMINRYSNPENKKFYGDHHAEIWGHFKAKGQGKDYMLSEKNKDKLQKVIDHINTEVPYKVNFLKSEMDKILRYEVSLKGAFFANLFKRHVFRRNDPVHIDSMKRYKGTASVLNNNAKDPMKITRHDRRNYKMMHKYLNRALVLIVGDNYTLKRHGLKANSDYNAITNEYKISKFQYAYTGIGKHDTAHMCEYFLNLCVGKLKSFIDEYTIDVIEPYDDVMSKIKHHNEQVKKKVELYNSVNHWQCIQPNGEYKRKKVRVRTMEGKYKYVDGAIITKATQLLSRKELMAEGMKTINQTILGSIITQLLVHQKSLDNIFNEMGTHKSTRSRLRADLRMFDIYDNTMNVSEAVIMKTDFSDYYWKTSGLEYQKKFYRNLKLISEDYGINPFDPQDEANIA